MRAYCGNILYKQPFKTSDDLYISFVTPNIFSNKKANNLLLQDRSRLLLQDRTSAILLQFVDTFRGLGIFLIDSNTPTLTGGGAGYGIGMITDTMTTSLSAISGMVFNVVLDMYGKYGQQNSIQQFNTGNTVPHLSSFAVRKGTTFDFVSSINIPKFTYPFNDNWMVYRIAFKNTFQELVIYSFSDDDVYVPIGTINTGLTLSQLPSGVKVGISWEGDFPINIKNVALHGST